MKEALTQREGYTVTFQTNLTEQQQEAVVRIFAGEEESEIAKAMGIKQDEVQSVLSDLKALVVKKGEIWPCDKTALIYTLAKLGDIRIEKWDVYE